MLDLLMHIKNSYFLRIIFFNCLMYRDWKTSTILMLLLFDDNNLKMARKPGKKQKENPVACTGEGKI